MEARQYLTEGKQRSIDLLQLAIRSLEDDLADLAPSSSVPPQVASAPSNKVFLVHGHDDAVKNEVALFLRAIGLDPIILHLQPNGGRDLLTKFREESAGAGFAVVLMTPDDEGGMAGTGANQPRARQNVVFELGFFIGKLGPPNVAALLKGAVERPSDFNGMPTLQTPSRVSQGEPPRGASARRIRSRFALATPSKKARNGLIL